MERLRIVKRDETSVRQMGQNGTTDPLDRFKAITRDLTEKALEVVNRISSHEASKSQPEPELVEEVYLLFHYLDFLKRFASSTA